MGASMLGRRRPSTMTSRPATQCYVYIHLPGATTAVVAGRFTLTTDRRVGQIGKFVYGRSYLERKEAVPPGLVLEARRHRTKRL